MGVGGGFVFQLGKRVTCPHPLHTHLEKEQTNSDKKRAGTNTSRGFCRVTYNGMFLAFLSYVSHISNMCSNFDENTFQACDLSWNLSYSIMSQLLIV